MEIRGPSYNPLTPVGYPPARPHPQQTNDQAHQSGRQPNDTPRPVRSLQAAQYQANEADTERNRPRFTNRDVSLSHQARQALHNYESTDLADGPELLNRVDVYV
ncbi:MAG: hypothetical protein OEZ39_05795 [Gammaproteobacteria bacterium]|nr:hypothetical protein [Gammaproteobacteria bacterium]MDH5651366.1 hypothetical protein [Gammaproteobacteria bacterium]